MNKSIKKLWIKALRSGKFKQTTGVLCDKTGYCCLGVLRSIMKPGDRQSYQGYGSLLTVAQRQQAGLRFDTCDSLADKNDAGFTFSQIADYIEARL